MTYVMPIFQHSFFTQYDMNHNLLKRKYYHMPIASYVSMPIHSDIPGQGQLNMHSSSTYVALTPLLSMPLAPDNCRQIHMWRVRGFPIGSPPEER